MYFNDFSDGVLVAEIIKFHIPKIVEIHNYPVTNSSTQKLYNWNTLNVKVFKKMGFTISKGDIEKILAYKPLAIENLLKKVYKKLTKLSQTNESNSINNSKLDLKNIQVNKIDKIDKSKVNQYDLSSKNNSSQEKDELFKRLLHEKDVAIEELKTTVDILNMKLKNSEEIQAKLLIQIKELSEKKR